ncbi:MAG: hypothetical protein ABSF44_12020 [Candidatus Bathyarchaeia archaeon]
MLPELVPIMLAISAITLLASVAAIKVGAKKMQLFMKVMKAVSILSIVEGIVDVVALITYFI